MGGLPRPSRQPQPALGLIGNSAPKAGAAAVRGGWTLRREEGSAASLHASIAALLQEGSSTRVARIARATAPALVLGSHQDASAFPAAALARAGIELVRRRSGGSAVLVGPGRVLWVDFVVPAGDPLWDDDVGRAAWWVGHLWVSALAPLAGGRPAPPSEVWTGPMRTNAWSSLICFAGLGPGEVTVGGAKVVGVCQRRTPKAALFQTAALLDWSPAEYLTLAGRAGAVPDDLQGAAQGLGPAAEAPLLAALDTLLMP